MAKKETPDQRKLRLQWEAKLKSEGLGADLAPDIARSSGLLDARDVEDGGTGGYTTD